MKNIIVILFSIILGVYIFVSTIGEDDSIKKTSGGVMNTQVEMLKTLP